MPVHEGSCHCGSVAFTVDADLTEGVACNCSICRRAGYVLAFVPEAEFVETTPPENRADYLFNKHVINHHFCPKCGIHPFAIGTRPDGVRMVALNLRCVNGLDLDKVAIRPHDGASI